MPRHFLLICLKIGELTVKFENNWRKTSTEGRTGCPGLEILSMGIWISALHASRTGKALAIRCCDRRESRKAAERVSRSLAMGAGNQQKGKILYGIKRLTESLWGVIQPTIGRYALVG
jgi:hypothetical protein